MQRRGKIIILILVLELLGVLLYFYSTINATEQTKSLDLQIHQIQQLNPPSRQSIPIIYFVESRSCVRFYESIPEPLWTSLTQAALHNDRFYILTSCQSMLAYIVKNRERDPVLSKVIPVDISSYYQHAEVKEFKRIFFSTWRFYYIHDNYFRYEFEYLCMLRWYMVLQMMKELNIPAVGYLDNDVMLYANMFDIMSERQDDIVMLLLPPRASSHLSYFTTRGLENFVEFLFRFMKRKRRSDNEMSNDMMLMRTYAFKYRRDKLIREGKKIDLKLVNDECWGTRGEPEIYQLCWNLQTPSEYEYNLEALYEPGTFGSIRQYSRSIFSFEGENASQSPSRVRSVTDTVTKKTYLYDRSLVVGDNNFDHDPQLVYVINKKLKQIVWIDGYPYFPRRDSPKLIGAFAIHFQGDSKPFMKHYMQSRKPRIPQSHCVCVADDVTEEWCSSCR